MSEDYRPEKLVRDLIPQFLSPEARTQRIRQVDNHVVASFAVQKVLEEAIEVMEASAKGDKGEISTELADLLEIMERLMALHGIGWDEVWQIKAQRRMERGAFEQNFLLRDPPKPLNRLISGGTPQLIEVLKEQLALCQNAYFAVSFLMQSGVSLLAPSLREALLRGAKIRLLTSDYLNVTDPDALDQVLALPGDLELKAYQEPGRSFHLKTYLFEGPGMSNGIVGSSNLSASAVTSGIEWNYRVFENDPYWPLSELFGEFWRLYHSPHSVAVDQAFIREYRARRKPMTFAEGEAIAQVHSQRIVPRPAQAEALLQLQLIRNQGEQKALVIAATGIGKTFLAAFDSKEFPRVLFLAHREELLLQASAAFQGIRPEARPGFYYAGKHDAECDILFASVSTLGRVEHLQRFSPDSFDYIVIDEFHHAAAESYLKVLHYFCPRFLLGLTATPYRGDNKDVFALCDGNVAYSVTFIEAIGFGWLAPFHYFGIYDETDYSAIPWRNGRYDTERLEASLGTDKRAEATLASYREHPSNAAMGFCVSISHAKFMAKFFSAHGIPSLAVHSGSDSPDRGEAIQSLKSGAVRCLFTVDLFNEGVDVPEIDLVMFLRPTESTTIFLQQLGRGLRLHPGKEYLTVLDFIGNYKKSHYKLALIMGKLDDEPEPSGLRKLIAESFRDGKATALDGGIEIHFDLQAIDLIKRLATQGEPRRLRLERAFQDIVDEIGHRPNLLELHRWGLYDVRLYRQEYGSWFAFLRAIEVIEPLESTLDAEVGEFLKELEITQMTKSYKMVLLQAFISCGGLTHPVGISDLVRGFAAFFKDSERHRRDIQETEIAKIEDVPESQLRAYLEKNPLAAWTNRGKDGRRRVYFAYDQENGVFAYTGPQATNRDAFVAAIQERIAYRLAEYFEQRYERKNVFNVINQGTDKGIIMLGSDEAAPIPRSEGWKRVKIGDRPMYAKFAKIAINVLKEKPDDNQEQPNRLTEVLEEMFGKGGYLPGNRNKVRISPEPSEPDTWRIEPFQGPKENKG